MSQRSDAISVERLTLVSRVGWLELYESVFVHPGSRVWADFDAQLIVIEHPTGDEQRLRARPTGPNSIR